MWKDDGKDVSFLFCFLVSVLAHYYKLSAVSFLYVTKLPS